MDWGKIVDPNFWRSYKIPAFAFALVALLLLMRNVSNDLEYIYIQNTATYALGASIIAYAHSLFYSTWMNRKKGEPDLPFQAQAIFVGLHILWFLTYWLSVAK